MPQTDKNPSNSTQFLSFIRQQAGTMRGSDVPPANLDAWKTQRRELRRLLIQSWGEFPIEPCPLKPRIVGEIEREGYRVQKLLLQPRPGVVMTANVYVPDAVGRRPAVLCVHGHWRLAKSEPVVQSRCIGLAKLGFLVLMVDAFGAGERGIGTALGEYHGEMVAATLWPTGLALAGLQVYENMRAVDYLLTRPDVDPDRIGVTGCSGGGNQTMYVGAIDQRLKSVVPVCSVGTYQAYLGAACCMCEVTPAALSYTEEAGVLSLVAPRALMLINATRDSFQFSVGEAKKSLSTARAVFRLYNKEDATQHVVVESAHGYNQKMREAMYGWMTKHLKGEGDGAPIAEMGIKTEEAETLACFPGNTRPNEFVTIPKFAAEEARRILKHRPIPDHVERWQADEVFMRGSLPRVLGGFPKLSRLRAKIRDEELGTRIEFSPEAGIRIVALHQPVDGKHRRLAVLLDLEQGVKAATTTAAEMLIKDGWDVVTVDLRGTGATAYPKDKIGRAADHNTAEWAMWIGRSLLGQWIWDVRRLLDALDKHAGGLPDQTALVGIGPASLIALCAAAFDRRVDRVATVGGLSSYVSDTPYENQRMGIMVPGILRDVGDIPQLAALTSPRRLVIANGVNGAGRLLSADEMNGNYAWTKAVFKLEARPKELRLVAGVEFKAVVAALS
jgi:dienelactone hydrolase